MKYKTSKNKPMGKYYNISFENSFLKSHQKHSSKGKKYNKTILKLKTYCELRAQFVDLSKNLKGR